MAIKETVTVNVKEKGARKAASNIGQVATGINKLDKAGQKTTRSQINVGKEASNVSRQFSAQASGLGGLVAAYAGAAATIFAVQQAFSALAKAAQAETVLRGTQTLATSIGESADTILDNIQRITRGQLTLVEAAENANIALSSGFSGEQIERIVSVSLKASRALGRNLTDALQRVVRGAAKLEPELLDELGIFARIDPAVRVYAASLGVAESSLTQFERRQAFVNAVITEGEKKFGEINVTLPTAQESLEKMSAALINMGLAAGSVLADAVSPLIDAISGSFSDTLAAFGLLAGLVFSKLVTVASGGIASFISRIEAGGAASFNFLARLTSSFREATKASQEFASSIKLPGLRGPKDTTAATRAAIATIASGTVQSVEQIKITNAAIKETIKLQFRDIKGAKLSGAARLRATQNVKALKEQIRLNNVQLTASNLAARTAAGGIQAFAVAASAAARGVLFLFKSLTRLVIFVSIAQFISSFLSQFIGFDIVGDVIESVTNRLSELRDRSKEAEISSRGFGAAIASSILLTAREANLTLTEFNKTIDAFNEAIQTASVEAFEAAKAQKVLNDAVNLGVDEGLLLKDADSDFTKSIETRLIFTKKLDEQIEKASDQLEKFNKKPFINAEQIVQVRALIRLLEISKDKIVDMGAEVFELQQTVGLLAASSGVAAAVLSKFVTQGILRFRKGAKGAKDILIELNGELVKIAEKTAKGTILIKNSGKTILSAAGQIATLDKKLKSANTRALDFSQAVIALESVIKRLQELGELPGRLTAEQKLQIPLLKEALNIYRGQLNELKLIEKFSKFITDTFTTQIKLADNRALTGRVDASNNLVVSERQVQNIQIESLKTAIIQGKLAAGQLKTIKAVGDAFGDNEKVVAKIASQIEAGVLAENAFVGLVIEAGQKLKKINDGLEKQLINVILKNQEKALEGNIKIQIELNKLQDTINKGVLKELQLRKQIFEVQTRIQEKEIQNAAKLREIAAQFEFSLMEGPLAEFFSERQQLEVKASIEILEFQNIIAGLNAAIINNQKTIELERDIIKQERINREFVLSGQLDVVKKQTKLEEFRIRNQEKLALKDLDIKRETLLLTVDLINAINANTEGLLSQKLPNLAPGITPDRIKALVASVREGIKTGAATQRDVVGEAGRAKQGIIAEQILQLREEIRLRLQLLDSTKRLNDEDLQGKLREAQEQLKQVGREFNVLTNVLIRTLSEVAIVVKEEFGQGLRDLNRAFLDGTLTMKNFKEGFRDFLDSLITSVQDAIFEETVVKPIQDIIGNLFGTAVPDGTFNNPIHVRDVDKVVGASIQDKIAAEFGEDFVPGVTDKVETIFDKFLTKGTQVFKDLGKGITEIFSGVADGLQFLFKSIVSSFTSGGGIGGGGGGFLSSLFGGGGSTAAGLGPQFTGTGAEALLASGSFVSGGLVQKLAVGGGVRDRVPTLLEPGEFVLRKEAVRRIGLTGAQTLNRGTSSSSPGSVQVNIKNEGTPQENVGQPKVDLDPEKLVINVVLRDLETNGPIRQNLKGLR